MSELSPSQREALGALLNAAPFAKVVRDLGRRFEVGGHELYLVGGTVRDALLDRASPDVDLTTDATPDQILAVVRGRGSASTTPPAETARAVRTVSSPAW